MENPQTLKCWDITQCQSKDHCPARDYKEKPCWEIAAERMDYQSAFGVCEDCFVYIALYDKTNSSLSEDEINQIWEQKGLCNKVSTCVLSAGKVEAA